jgi:hypothetical protein
MDFQKMPPYRGLADSPKEWGEPNEQGELPSIALRDFLALALLIVFGLALKIGFAAHLWVRRQGPLRWNEIREKQMEEEDRRFLF